MSDIETVWLTYRKNLLAFIRQRVSTNEDAEDILNDVFAQLIKQNQQTAQPDNVSAWLYRVSRNRIIDYYRTKKAVDELPDDLASKSDDVTALQELSQCLLPMIQQLPDHYRDVLLLSEIDEQSHKAVASQLGISLSAAKARVLRGREKLYQSLVKCCEFTQDHAGNVSDFHKKHNDSCKSCD